MTKPNEIEIKYEDLDQYDAFDEDLMLKKEKRYAFLIGSFLIWFSNLEYYLDVAIANLISEGGHDRGYLIIKNLDLSSKIDLFYSLSMPMVFHCKKKKKLTAELNLIRNQLQSLSTLRNKIAHAKWYSLDSEGYVRVDIKTNKDNGLIKFRKFKITPAIIKSGMKETEVLSEKIDNFTDALWNSL
jgi:hypothetical protein